MSASTKFITPASINTDVDVDVDADYNTNTNNATPATAIYWISGGSVIG